MRQVYALLGLVKKWGAERVEAACRSALDHEVVNVGLIGRMVERGTVGAVVAPTGASTVTAGRFARDAGHFAVRARHCPHPGISPGPIDASHGHTAAGFHADLAEEAR
jgi:hypothetical protein